jgi:hypothetical protein
MVLCGRDAVRRGMLRRAAARFLDHAPRDPRQAAACRLDCFMPPFWPCAVCAQKWPLRDRWSTTACHLAKQRLCTDACGCCEGKYSTTAVLADVPGENAVEYKGILYRTLDGASPLDARTDNFLYQRNYFAVPSGWALAADNADSLYVISSSRWGTYVMHVAGGRAYWTLTALDPGGGHYSYYGYSPGSLFTTSHLSTSGSTYKTSFGLILISKTGSLPCTACPAGESRDSGARVREAYACEFGEERMLHQNI